jgi:hypothetical protein
MCPAFSLQFNILAALQHQKWYAKSKVIFALNYLLKHYAVKAYGGVVV